MQSGKATPCNSLKLFQILIVTSVLPLFSNPFNILFNDDLNLKIYEDNLVLGENVQQILRSAFRALGKSQSKSGVQISEPLPSSIENKASSRTW